MFKWRKNGFTDGRFAKIIQWLSLVVYFIDKDVLVDKGVLESYYVSDKS